jgi:aspartate-semialdehyde dehydrogenase
MSRKYRVGILGATGMVGQRFIELLVDHPQFEVTAVAASDRSQGKTFGEACTWRLSGEMPAGLRGLPVQPPAPPLDCDLVFSSLPGDIARETEGSFAAAGYPVISNSSAFRMDEDVPLLIPGSITSTSGCSNGNGTNTRRADSSSRIRIARPS